MGTEAVVDRRTLRERTTAQIRQLIIGGRLKPGEHVVEVRLSDELKVSRSTLRESLRAVEVEGLLVGDGRGHLSVRKLSSRQVLEVFEVRTSLEILAATKLTHRMDRAVVAAELRQVLAPLRNPDLEFARQIEFDLGFHARMFELSGNETLFESWSRLIGRLEMVIIAAGPIRASGWMRYDEHDLIVKAIETGSVSHSENVVRAHMEAFCAAYVADAFERERRTTSQPVSPPPRDRPAG